jgi:flagellum-specific peptidoglycan hydrolase FlgJ
MPSYITRDQDLELERLRFQGESDGLINDFVSTNAPPPEPVKPQPIEDGINQLRSFAGSLTAPFKEAADVVGQKVSEIPAEFKSFTDSLSSPFREEPVQQAAPSSMPSNGIQPVQRGPSAAGTPLDSSTPDAYKSSLMANAQVVADKYGLPASIIAAIPIQEAGYKGSELTRRANNLFSIKGEGPAGSEHFGSVWEVIDGKDTYVPASFRKYNSPAESFEDFAKLITESPRYANAVKIYRETGDQDAFIRAVQAGGYATDPTWAGKVSAIAREMPSGGTAAQSGRLPSPGESTSQSFNELTPNQYTAGQALSKADADAACGPAAAVAFARRNGRNPTLDEAVALAREVGWTPDAGMAGPASQVKLLQKMGIAATLTGVDEQRIAADVQAGNPVTLDTPGHYFVAEKYDPSTGKFDFGNSAKVLRASGGQSWFTLQEAAQLGMGAFRAAIHMDNPETPSPSVVAGKSSEALPPPPPELDKAIDTAVASGTFAGMAAPFRENTTVKGVPIDQAMANDRTFQQKDMGRYASDESGIVYPGDEPLTALPSAQPGGVEPASPEATAPSPGNPPTKFERQVADAAASRPPAEEDPWTRVANALRDALAPTGIPENPEPQFPGVKPVVRQAPIQSNPPPRDIRGDYAPPVQEDVIQRNPSEQAQGMTNALTAQQAGIDATPVIPQPAEVLDAANNALGGNPQNEIQKASRGEAVNPLAYATELSYGAADAILPERVKNARLQAGPIDITGRDVAAAALDPSNITSPLDAVGLAGGALVAGAAKNIVKKNADNVLHVVGWGYKKGVSPEARDMLENVLAKAPGLQSSTYSYDDVAKYAQEWAVKRGAGSDAVRHVTDAWANADTRDLAAEMVTLMRGSDVALEELGEKVKIVKERAARGEIGGEEADGLIDALAKVAATDQFILGNKKASESVARALNQLKGGVDVKESQAWLKSFDMLSKPMQDAQKEIERVIKGGTPGSGTAKRLGEAADAMDAGADRFGDEAAEKAVRKARTPKDAVEPKADSITPEQSKNLPEFNGPKGVDPQKVQEQLDNAAAARNLQDDLEAEDGVPNSRPQKKIDDRPDWSVYYPKKSKVPDMAAAGDTEPAEATLREQVKFRESMKREIDNKIQKIIDAEKRADVRKQVEGQAKLAKSDIEKIISNPGGAGHQDIRDNLDILLRQMREGSNLGERVANEIEGTLDKRMAAYQKKFGETVETNISNFDAKVSREEFVAMRKEADDLLKRIQANPDDAALRRQFEDLTKRIGEHPSAGAYEAVKFYDKASIKDEARTLRELARVMSQNPREIFQTGYVDLLNQHLDALKAVNQQGRDRAKSIKEGLPRRGAKKMIGQQEDEEGIKTFLASMAHVDFNNPKDVGRFMDSVAHGTKTGLATEMMMAFMLSSPVTQGVNILSNVAQGVSHFGLQKPAMIAYDAVRNPANRAFASSELSAANCGLREGLVTGLQMATEIMRYGSTAEARNRAGALADFSDTRRELWTEQFGPIGTLMHVPSTRPLEAADTVFGQMFYNANLRSLAERKAMKSGGTLTPIDILGNLDKHLDIVEEAGKLSDYSLLKTPGTPSRWINDAVRNADKVGANAFGGHIGGDEMRFAIGLVMPFTRVPWNFLKQGLDYTPIGTASNIGNLIAGAAKKTLTPEQEAEYAWKSFAGLSLAGTAYGLYSGGLITGDGPKDNGKRNLMIAEGWQPRSIRVGDRWVSYDSLPVTIPFAATVTALEWRDEAIAKAQKKDASAGLAEGIGGIGAGMSSAALGQAFVRNLADAYESLRGRGSAPSIGEALAGGAKNVVTRFEPSLIAWMARLGDDYQRETRLLDEPLYTKYQRGEDPQGPVPGTEGILGAVTERSPLRGKLPPRQNIVGEDVPNDGNVAGIGPRQSVIRPNPVIDALVANGVNLPQAPKEISSVASGNKIVPLGVKVELTEEQRRAYQRYLGDSLKQFAPTVKTMPKDVLETLVNTAQRDALIALQRDPKYGPQIESKFAEAAKQGKK